MIQIHARLAASVTAYTTDTGKDNDVAIVIARYALSHLNAVCTPFTKLSGVKLTIFVISFIKRTQKDVQDAVTRDAKLR